MSCATSQYKAFARAYLRRKRQSLSQEDSTSKAFTTQLLKLWDLLPSGSTVAAFLPLPTEPPIAEGLAFAHQLGHKVIVPVVCPERRLAWVRWEPTSQITTNALGISEPQGERLGPQAFLEANLRLIPALAYDVHGNRLGQGGGYYDRLLALLPAQAFNLSTLGLVFSQEVVDGLPHSDWDATLRYVLTEQGIQELGIGSENRVQ